MEHSAAKKADQQEIEQSAAKAERGSMQVKEGQQMAAKTYSGKEPENMKKTVGYFLSYLGRHKRMLFLVAVSGERSARCANLAGHVYDPSG